MSKDTSSCKKVLIVEKNNYHLELIPSLIYYFRLLGYKVFVHMPLENQKGLEQFMKPLGFKYERVHAINNTILQNFDVVINNTYYPFDKGVPHLKHLHLSSKYQVGSICHLINDLKPLDILKNNHTLLTLSEHCYEEALRELSVKSELIQKNSVCFFYPIYFGLKYKPRTVDGKITFVIQGSFNDTRRDYTYMERIIEDMSNQDRFTFLLMGSSSKLGDEIRSRLSKYKNVVFKTNLRYKDYFQNLINSHFILPLIHPNSSVTPLYFKNKISSSIMLGLGFSVPCILHKDIKDVYGFNNDNSLSYANYESFRNVFQTISSMNQSTYDRLVDGVNVKAQQLVSKSLDSLKTAF